jgi:hypothetical protein
MRELNRPPADRGRRRARFRSAVPSLTVAFALGGCAGPAVIGALPSGPSAPVATDAAPVDSSLARTLETATAGTTFGYRLVDGGEGSFVLGPLYQSGRGVPCRVGRLSPAEIAGVSLNTYPFCRFGDQWYAMRPVVVSGS